jgi:hypothetical protein
VTVFNRPINEPIYSADDPGIAVLEGQVAEVYCGPREYARTNCWDTPGVVRLRPEDHLDGIHWRACEDCGGTGHFPVPEPDLMEDSCIACKGTGLQAVMA